MYNFLEPKLLPKVNTKAACMDGYEVENLISDNYMVKSRGFLAYTSIKPPVDLTFQTICAINVHHVVISTVIGSQKSTGIELLIKSQKSELIAVGMAFFDTPGVVFCNSRLYSKQNPPPNCSQYHLAFFKSNAFRQFLNATEIVVRITRTDKSVPCIGGVEVWGTVSKSCSETTVNTINQLMQKTNIKMLKTDQTNCKVDNLNIPDDFKDALTYEIMSLPMTLPSGHTIDQTTLEKCINNDNTYGRKGMDPFTGLSFTSNRKPQFNIALKTRIDMFLVENAHRKEVANVQRTVGRQKIPNKTTKSCSLLSKKCEQNSICKDNPADTFKSYCESINKKPRTSGENDLDDLLYETVDSVVNSSSFTKYTGEQVGTKSKTYKCEECNSEENLYELPCTHLYCRKCLIKLCKILNCKVCKKNFCKNDPKIFHVSKLL